MSVGLVGRKCGMTRIFRENGDSVPVTVIEALPNRVTTVKTAERDGYRAVQVTVVTPTWKAEPDAEPAEEPGPTAGQLAWMMTLTAEQRVEYNAKSPAARAALSVSGW